MSGNTGVSLVPRRDILFNEQVPGEAQCIQVPIGRLPDTGIAKKSTAHGRGATELGLDGVEAVEIGKEIGWEVDLRPVGPGGLILICSSHWW